MERKKRTLKEELKDDANLRRLAVVVRDSNDAIMVEDFSGRILAWNRGAVRMYGYTEKEALGMSALDIVPEECREENRRILASLERGELITSYETRRVTKDGRVLDVWLIVTTLPDEEGGIRTFSTTERNISERKRAEEKMRRSQEELSLRNRELQQRYAELQGAEEALRGSEARYRDLADSEQLKDDANLRRLAVVVRDSNDAITVQDFSGRILAWNLGAVRMYGYTEKEALGMSFLDLVPEDSREENRGMLASLERGESITSFETRRLTKDGRVLDVWLSVWVTATPLPDEEGRVRTFSTTERNISERKRTDEALRESETKFRLVADSTYDWVYWLNNDGCFVYSSPSCERITGYLPEEFISDPSLSLRIVHPDDRAQMADHFKDFLPSPDHGETEFRILCRDGTVRWIGHVCEPIITEDGRNLGRRSSNRDITKRKQAEETLKTSEEWFRTAVVSLTDVVYEWDLKEKVDWFGDIDGIMGYPAGGFPRTLDGWAATLHPEDKERVWKAVEGQLKGAEPYVVEYRVRKKDGEWLWWSSRGTALRDEWGEPYKWIGAIADITDRKQVKKELREKDKLIVKVVNATPDFIFVKDTELRTILCNAAYATAIGKKPDELIGHTDIENGWDPGLVKGNPAKGIRGFENDDRDALDGKEVHNPNDFANIGNEIRIFDTYKLPLYDDDNRIFGLLGIARDVTERKRAEEEIQRLNAELEQRVLERTAQLEIVNKELEAFSYSVSHDLRAPLRAIDGFSVALVEDFGKTLEEGAKAYLDRIRSGVKRMADLIDALLTLSRLSRAEMTSERLDLSALARIIVTDLEKSQPGRKAEWRIAEGLIAQGDPRLLRSLLENLLGNAWKFTSKEASPVIEFGAMAQEDGKLAYFVRDNGAGFDMAYSNKLFGAFKRLHTTTEFPGLGIGLATVQRIIHRHGGRVWAEGEVGKGAAFYFTLT